VRTKLKDHSIFVAFAPKDNPKIAIAIMIENGGFGANVAGPIASLMVEKYLRKKISRTDLEVRVLNKSLVSEYAKVGGINPASLIESTPKDSVLKAKIIVPKKAVPKTEPKKTALDTIKEN
jgi:penicillin-binding protein 2